jgi:hypothetical protein
VLIARAQRSDECHPKACHAGYGAGPEAKETLPAKMTHKIKKSSGSLPPEEELPDSRFV